VAIGKSQITTKVRTNQNNLGHLLEKLQSGSCQECIDELLFCVRKLEESGTQEQKESGPSVEEQRSRDVRQIKG